MELEEHDFLEELLSLRRDTDWDSIIPTETNDFFSNAWNFDYFFDQNTANSSLLSVPEMEIIAPLPFQADMPEIPITEREEESGFMGNEVPNLEIQNACKIEANQSPEIPVLRNVGRGNFPMERKNRAKKLQGQPSKNLMAERRRRKRLNDRLSMLRSIVPKISKMDRTAILADSIEYMKELVEKIGSLQKEVDSEDTRMLKETKPTEFAVRNSPKFEVEKRNGKTRIEISCGGKAGMLLSTVDTIEALGLDIQHCVVSCFNDFSFQASCSQELKQRTEVKPEELKEALFRNAGYGGSSL